MGTVCKAVGGICGLSGIAIAIVAIRIMFGAATIPASSSADQTFIQAGIGLGFLVLVAGIVVTTIGVGVAGIGALIDRPSGRDRTLL